MNDNSSPSIERRKKSGLLHSHSLPEKKGGTGAATLRGMITLRYTPRVAYVLRNPHIFAFQVLKGFKANQGLLLSGAVAYYALLSIVPMLILMVIALSHIIDREILFATIKRSLEYIVPSKSKALVAELRAFLSHSAGLGWLLFVTMLFFSSLGFRVLENAIFVIFLHRVQMRSRPLIVSLLLPFGYILFIGAALFLGTFIMADLMAIGRGHLSILGHSWSLGGFSRTSIYLIGILGEILLISGIYFFMPIGRLSIKHALIGGTTAALLWELVRFALSWYIASISQVNIVYGSLATAIIVLLSLELAATILLLGAQVIAEYERIELDKIPG